MGPERDANLHQPVGELEQIKDTNLPSLHFPLLFPHGEQGWHLEVRHQGDATSHKNNRMGTMHNSDATWPPAQQPISVTKWCVVTTNNATQQPWPPAQHPISLTKWCDVTTHNARRVLFQRSLGASKSCCEYTFFSFSGAIMVHRVVKIFHEYGERLRSSDNVPRFSYRRRMMRDDGDPNRFFLMYPCSVIPVDEI